MGNFIKSKIFVLSLATTALITGCTVSPKPISKEELKSSVEKDLKTINTISLPITKAISLDEAINRAIKNNIRHKVQMMESALAYKQIDLVYYDMLPTLTSNAGYTSRNNYAASASTTFENGKPSPIVGTPTYSVSQDKQRFNADITFNWNVLDFGLSYVRAQQQADKYLMAKENERKVIHNIVQEVRRTYYKTVSSNALLKKIIPMMDEVKLALSDSRKIKKLRLGSPMKALSYQRDLLEVLRSLQALERNLLGSKIELSELMGLKAGTKFELSEKVKKDYKLPTLNLKLDQMEKIALENRPEIVESRYKQRISQKETTTALLKMLPGINLNTVLSYDNSDYILNNDWTSYGMNISWNLLNIFKYDTNKKIAKTRIELAKEQKLAVSMAVLSQVHLSIVNFNQAKKEYLLSKEYLNVAQEIFKLTEVTNNLNMNSRLVFIKEKLNYILATLRHSSSYANVQNSYGRIFASLGTYEEMNKKAVKINPKKFKAKKTVPKKMEPTKVKAVKPVMKKEIEKVSTDKIMINTLALAKKNVFARSKASNSSTYNLVLPKYKKVDVIRTFKNEEGMWAETPIGYINTKSLNLRELGKNTKALTSAVNSDKIKYLGKSIKAANIREKAKWKSKVKYLLPRNKAIDILEIVKDKNSTWYKTPYGYVSSQVVKLEGK